MKRFITIFFLLIGFHSFSQLSILAIQDFDTIQTPSMSYVLTSGTLEFANGTSTTSQLPVNSPFGINGSWAWKEEGQSGGVTLTFNNVNITGYDTAYITFKLAAFSISGTSGGTDAADYVTTSVSINGGTTWYDQIKVTGTSNSAWAYTASGTAERVFSTASVTTFAPTTSSGLAPDGISTVTIKVPNTTNQVAVRIKERSSTATERWIVDNVAVSVYGNNGDAGISSFVNPTDSLCSGNQNVIVNLKNHALTVLNSATIIWNVNGVPQTNFTWSGSLNPAGVIPVTIGTYNFQSGVNYSITAKTSLPNNGPDGNTSNDSIAKNNIIVLELPVATISTPPSTSLCDGDSLTLTANTGSGYSYKWLLNNNLINGANNSSLKALQAGNYAVIITNSGICSDTSQSIFLTSKPKPLVNLGNDTSICSNKSIVLNAGSGNTSYLWSTGAITQTLSVDSTGTGHGVKTISVLVNKNGCVNSDTIKITFINCTGINEFYKISNISLFPNPSKGLFNVEFEGENGNYVLRVFDLTGKVIYQESFTINSYKSSRLIDLTSQPKGIYLIKVNNDKFMIVKKVVVE